MDIKFSFVLQSERSKKTYLNQDGTSPVSIRAYLNGKYRYFPTGIKIEPAFWDRENRQVSTKHKNAFHLNKKLREKRDALEEAAFLIYRREGGVSLDRISLEELDKADISFTDFYRQQLENFTFSRSNFTDHRQTFEKLCQYKKTVHFYELNSRLVIGFDAYLRKLGLSANTIAKHHKNLKKWINLAKEFRHLGANEAPYLGFKVRREQTERIYLTEQELTQVENLTFTEENKHLERIRDFFLFTCYTGLRYSDASRVTVENLNHTPEGIELYFKARKTGKPFLLQLWRLFNGKPNDLVKRYLEAYDLFYYDDPDDPQPLFFGLSNPYVNRELKTIARMVENARSIVKEKLSVHSGRHTFGTILAGKVSVPVLQQLLQHSKLKETMIYVHLNQEMINEALDRAKW